MIRILASLLVVVIAADKANASSCNRENKVTIKMSAGAVCWSYQGTATHFEGTFSRGQEVTVEMHGISVHNDDTFTDKTKLMWEARNPGITGPGNTHIFSDIDNKSGKLVATLPVDGTYVFQFGPCAMWNNYGLVTICAQSATARDPAVFTYSEFVEDPHRIGAGIDDSMLKTAANMVRENGWRCDSISSARIFLFRSGMSLSCNKFRYEYEIEDRGGKRVVTLK